MRRLRASCHARRSQDEDGAARHQATLTQTDEVRYGSGADGGVWAESGRYKRGPGLEPGVFRANLMHSPVMLPRSSAAYGSVECPQRVVSCQTLPALKRTFGGRVKNVGSGLADLEPRARWLGNVDAADPSVRNCEVHSLKATGDDSVVTQPCAS